MNELERRSPWIEKTRSGLIWLVRLPYELLVRVPARIIWRITPRTKLPTRFALRHALHVSAVWLYRGALVSLIMSAVVAGVIFLVGVLVVYLFNRSDLVTAQSFGAFSQAVVGLAAGTVAILTFLVNYRQKQDHFERLELEQRFKDIQDRFSDDNVLMRANAAVRLADIATTRRPGRLDLKSARSYPYYELVAAELCAALYLEDNPGVLDAIRTALREMMAFDDQGLQRLLHLLIVKLVDGNKSAHSRMLNAWGSYAKKTDDDLNHEWTRLSRMESNEARGLIIRGWLKSDEFALSRKSSRLTTVSLECRRTLAYNSSLHWLHSRDALADAIKHLDFKGAFSVSRYGSHRAVPLVLEYCQMQGAELSLSNLQLSKMLRTQLQGASMIRAKLQTADLNEAQLQGAQLFDARLQGASLNEAQLQRAHLVEAKFQGAHLFKAQLQGAYMSDCEFQDAELYEANMQGAVLPGANFSRAYIFGAKLFGAQVRNPFWGSASFANCDWWEANFRQQGENEEGNEVDHALIDWLDENWPSPAEFRPGENPNPDSSSFESTLIDSTKL